MTDIAFELSSDGLAVYSGQKVGAERATFVGRAVRSPKTMFPYWLVTVSADVPVEREREIIEQILKIDGVAAIENSFVRGA